MTTTRNINSPEGDTPAPKRKIIRRIVRHVPKQVSMPAVASAPVARSAPTMTTGPKTLPPQPLSSRIIEPSAEAHALLADEEPVSQTGQSIEFPLVEPQPESELAKGVILNQFAKPKGAEQMSTSRPKPGVSSTAAGKDGRAPIESIWPYIAAARQHVGEPHADVEYDENGEAEEPSHNFFSWIPWVFGPILLLALIIVGISYFSGATVVVTPKTQQLALSADISAVKNADPTKEFPLAVLPVTDKVFADVDASESKTSVAAASGKITVLNKQTSAQKLIKATRFEASNGKIYRIHDSIVVPAAGKDGAPGSFVATVFAESSGPDYNLTGDNTFTIPGFKGKPQFTQVTAKSSGDITGGSSGVKKSLGDDQLHDVAQKLRIELENKLRAKFTQQITQAQVSYESLYQFTYKDPTLAPSDAPEKVRVVLEGTLAAPVFDRALFSNALAQAAIKDYKGAPVSIGRIESLPVTLSGDPKTDLMTVDKATFHVEGQAAFTWKVDTDAFARALLNVAKSDVPRVMANFPSIDHVDATLRPFWKQYFPGDVKNIMVTIRG